MKKIQVLFIVAFAAAFMSAHAAPLIDPNGTYCPSRPTRIELDGATVMVGSDAWLVENAGWRLATAEETVAWHASQEAAAAEAEAQRIDNKSDNLKQAENRFISAILEYNAEHPESQIELTDGFLEIDAAIEGSSMNDNQKVKFALRLRTYWDLVLFHGGRFGDVQYHPEVEE